MTKEEFERRYQEFISNYTSAPRPCCSDCGEEAFCYDQIESLNYCDKCLKESLKQNIEELKRWTSD